MVAFAALCVAQIANRHNLQSSLAVVLVATAASFFPGLPRFELNHETILGIIMPPLIFSAAREFPRSRFRRNFRKIFGLGVTLVILTTVGIAFLTNWLIPTLALSGACVLAAIASPPDTVTTVVRVRSFGLTNRCISVLTGESIVNDAAACPGAPET